MPTAPSEGDFLTQTGSTIFLPTPTTNGSMPDLSDTLMTSTGGSGSGVLATLQFQVIAPCTNTPIKLQNIVLLEPNPIGTMAGTPNPEITPTSTSATAAVTLAGGGPPVANAGNNQVVLINTPVTFNGSKSLSSGNNPTYTWSFFDGAQKTLDGVVASYTFTTEGTYAVSLTLQDSLGSSNSTIAVAVVSKVGPVANITLQGVTGQSALVDQVITFNGVQSYAPGGETIQSYLWKMGDGSQTMNTSITSHTYTAAGTYNVSLTVTDADGNTDTASVTINVVQTSTSAPTPSSSAHTTPSPSQSQDTTPQPTPTQTQIPIQQSESLPTSVLAILVLMTLFVFGGSFFWLRKRT